MDFNAQLAALRQLLSSEVSLAHWLELVSMLDRWPEDTLPMALEYTESHLESSCPSWWRRGWGQWSKESLGWQLSRPSARPIPTLPGGQEVFCPAGTYTIGVEEKDKSFEWDFQRVDVTQTRSWWMSTTAITQEQWQTLMKLNPSEFEGEHRPVEFVSWWDGIAFCNALSRAAGLDEAYILTNESGIPGDKAYKCDVEWKGFANGGYRLPTEIEWEIACRAGSLDDRYGELDDIAWTERNAEQTQPVALKEPNVWGLYDMLGNIDEWCWDWFDPDVPPEGAFLDYPGLSKGEGRVLRGGCFTFDKEESRASARCYNSNSWDHDSGFRICRTHLS
jgi:formylglycine-generating enzyme required for sulfatase activity